ncbi:hypothetical protein ABZ599_16690 [Streptomyces misionensis]|uniref:hypothetical protein n=1 Tax=Streptomyces misionensis TaxID=67331 RepID=UPI003402DF5B
MTGLWRQVLNDTERVDSHSREQLLALGAAELAHARRAAESPVTVDDVQRIALAEFGLFLDEQAATRALREWSRPR